MPDAQAMHAGGCLCGAVRYRIRGALRAVHACHCSQCRRTSGHYVAMTNACSTQVEFTSSEGLRWYKSSDIAERGFCGVCGGNLFWRPFAAGGISIAAGTLDTPTGLAMEQHIFVADKSDYYTIEDGLPQKERW